MKERVMGGACDTHGEGKNAYRVNRETWRKRNTWKAQA